MALDNDISLFEGRQLTLLSEEDKVNLLTLFGAQENVEWHGIDSYNDYIAYIDLQVRDIRRHGHTGYALETFRDVARIIEIVKDNPHDTMGQIIRRLRNPHDVPFEGDATPVVRAVDFALKLWLTINFQTAKPMLSTISRLSQHIEWHDDETLAELLEGVFAVEKCEKARSLNSKLDSKMTANYLVEVCQIKLSWTDNLLDHLLLDRKRRLLMVYRHKVLLDNHAKCISRPIMPEGLMEETIDTLNLLFPYPSRATKRLLRKEKQRFYQLGSCGRAVNLDLDHYRYWQSRLQALRDLYEDPPRHWKQLLYDKRNLTSFVSLWLAVLVLVLTVVSIVFGSLSTVYAIKQYNLAVAQACLIDNAHNLLPGYC